VRSSWGRQVNYSLFGESHGEGIGITIHHLPAGFTPNMDAIRAELDRRKPGTGIHATPRKETDAFRILSGMYEERLTGAPLTVFFPNQDTRSGDYQKLNRTPRPSHADFSATIKYHGCNDYRGGGHFSGRLTAPVVFAGALAAQLLERQGVSITGHILKIGTVEDRYMDPLGLDCTEPIRNRLKKSNLPFLEETAAVEAHSLLEAVRSDGDSVGGQVEIAATGVPAGWGEPVFDALESTLAHLLFAIPGVKAVEFGAGSALAGMRGSEANDPWIPGTSAPQTSTNNSGGINGGISNGMPVVFRVTFRPTPSIAKEQQSIDLETGETAELTIKGRHDPCIVPRACPVVEAVTAMALLEAMLDQQINTMEVWR